MIILKPLLFSLFSMVLGIEILYDYFDCFGTPSSSYGKTQVICLLAFSCRKFGAFINT